MKARDFILTAILVFIARGLAFADIPLDRTEILQIFQALTAQPKKTWIPAGTIEATHLAYKASSGYMTDSTVIVKCDGDKFYWEININSRARETEPQGPSQHDFNLNWNRRRVFAWDGQRYTMYFKPGNNAIVTENPSDIPAVVNGPLTAGVVPWGYGIYTLESLSAAESSGWLDDQGLVHLTINSTGKPEIVLVLDPAKNYALLSCSINKPGYSSILKTYGDYEELAAGKWVPTTILIERYDNSSQTPELLTHDYWDINLVSLTPPQVGSFDVGYQTDALVEHHSPVTDEPLSYRYRTEVDTESLLYERLVIAAAGDTPTRNCATLAMKHVSAQFGTDVTDSQLADLISEPNEGTSLYELREFAKGLGFYCLAVKTDLATLKGLNGPQAILHLPGPNHYVVLEHIDDEYVWIVDLDGNKFYYRTKLDLFDLDWSAGTALLVSNEPLNLRGNFTELSDKQLQGIIGGFPPNYSCTDLIQQYDIEFCSEMIGGLCGGRYYTFYNRYGCEENEQGGTCTGDDLVGNVSCLCIEDPHSPGACNLSGNYYSQYIRACK
jgi:bacteriocin-like protein